MTIEEAENIIETYERMKDKYCTCFQGHPPCSYCECCPSEELYKKAQQILGGIN